uniref:TIL domain-containing protein n=1 Tax=Anopheles minimus TaxID=112268 RepID=A0A182WI24_9DIPT
MKTPILPLLFVTLFLAGSLCQSDWADYEEATAEPVTQTPATSDATKESTTPAADTTTTRQETTTETETPAPTTEQEETAPPIICTDPREIYNECGSACDDRTCDNLRRPDVLCSKQCVEGCYCRNGYVRDRLRRCIPAYRCYKGWW